MIPGITPTNLMNRSFSSHILEKSGGIGVGSYRSGQPMSTSSIKSPIANSPQKQGKAKKFTFTGVVAKPVTKNKYPSNMDIPMIAIFDEN